MSIVLHYTTLNLGPDVLRLHTDLRDTPETPSSVSLGEREVPIRLTPGSNPRVQGFRFLCTALKSFFNEKYVCKKEEYLFLFYTLHTKSLERLLEIKRRIKSRFKG